jgi:hypothetical protein
MQYLIDEGGIVTNVFDLYTPPPPFPVLPKIMEVMDRSRIGLPWVSTYRNPCCKVGPDIGLPSGYRGYGTSSPFIW